jgi:hypothetical protein
MKEIIIIETNKQGAEALRFRQKIRNFLNELETVYQIYEVSEEESEEEIYRRDMRLANQDPERQKEIKFWDKIQNQDNAKLNSIEDDGWDWN